MIERLKIINFAIIDQLEIRFNKGFQVFTGETGAGKSILLGAIGLLIGNKADSALVGSEGDKAVVEASFTIDSQDFKNYLKDSHIETEEDLLIIRREVSKNGKSRNFINGNQETLSRLSAIGEWLLDIHGQHDHQVLLYQKNHLNILDLYSHFDKDLIEMKSLSQELKQKTDEKAKLQEIQRKIKEDKIFFEYAVKEIDELNLYETEEEDLREELQKIEKSELLKESFSQAYLMLYEDDQSVLSVLSGVNSHLEKISGLDQRYRELLDFLEDAHAKILESANLITAYQSEFHFDENRMNEIIEKLEKIKELKRKYKENDVKGLTDYRKECSEKLENLRLKNESLEQIEKQINDLIQKNIQKARELSEKRKKAAAELEKKIVAELKYLGMEQAEFKVDIKYVREEKSPFHIQQIPVKIGEKGMDRIEFLISTNTGQPLKPLSKIASGGEISRIMLALKTILAGTDRVGTLIFDEIDTGIGGVTANRAGEKMQSLALNKQLVVITHLPQIASKAGVHFDVSKKNKNGKTVSEIRQLDTEQRITVIARMLGGESDVSRKHAVEMLNQTKTQKNGELF